MAHFIISIFFVALIISLFISAIISWIPNLGPGNPIVRVFNTITAPLLNPVVKRLPRLALGMFDFTYTVAFFFVWWVLMILQALINQALPRNW
ncbi:MAG TPA: YggT family protein [Ktedonobacterales bacterium]|nr:YggT family protein [Ktedonobacterales bacterium]